MNKSERLEVGHVCQNLYLACTALHAGTCAIAAYDQEACDRCGRENQDSGKDADGFYNTFQSIGGDKNR